MKNILNFSLLTLTLSTGGFYSLNFNTPDGNLVTLSSYAGHKIVIVAFNPASADFSQLKMLDSVQNNFPAVKFIAVPGMELASGQIDSLVKTGDSSLMDLRSRLGLSLLVTRAMYVKKTDSLIQHSLLSWLTHVSQNTHFNRDVEAEGQLFFVNESGILYSVLPKATSKNQIEQVINSTIIQ